MLREVHSLYNDYNKEEAQKRQFKKLTVNSLLMDSTNTSMYLTVAIKYAYLMLRFCRLSHFAGINKNVLCMLYNEQLAHTRTAKHLLRVFKTAILRVLAKFALIVPVLNSHTEVLVLTSKYIVSCCASLSHMAKD